jgi:predicted nucleic acid-binding protein
MVTIYLGTSALLRACLISADDHAACSTLLANSGSWRLISSELLALEARRVGVRLANEHPKDPDVRPAIDQLLAHVSLLQLRSETLASAAGIPQTLKSLDAIHLATALSVRSAITALVTYDRGLARVASVQGFTCLTASEALSELG